MKKHILTLITIFTMIAAPALAGVWVAQSSYGPTCYLVKINNSGFIGTGVVKGTLFTGFLKINPNPLSAYTGTSYAYNYQTVVDCIGTSSEQQSCALNNARYLPNYSSNYGGFYYNNWNSSLNTVYVKGMTITSAQPTACW